MTDRCLPGDRQPGGPLYPHPLSAGRPAPPPKASNTSSWSLSWSPRSPSEAPLLLPFPELRAPRGGAGGAAWREENRGQEGGQVGADKAGARTGSFWDSPNFKYSVQLSDHRPELVGWYLF